MIKMLFLEEKLSDINWIVIHLQLIFYLIGFNCSDAGLSMYMNNSIDTMLKVNQQHNLVISASVYFYLSF